MISCDFYSSWVIVIDFDTRWLVNDFLLFLFIMSDCDWFRHTVIDAWMASWLVNDFLWFLFIMSVCDWFRHTVISSCFLVISIHHEWLWLISTHGDWWITSCDFYASWVIVIGFDTRWLVHDLLLFLFTMSDCDWFRHTVIAAWVLVNSTYQEWLWLISTHGD